MREELPACPPGPKRSSTNVLRPSLAAYTAAPSPAGPLPMMTVSKTPSGMLRSTPARRASSVMVGFFRTIWPPQAMTGKCVAAASSVCGSRARLSAWVVSSQWCGTPVAVHELAQMQSGLVRTGTEKAQPLEPGGS